MMVARLCHPKMGGLPPNPPEVFQTKRIRTTLTLTRYLKDAEQAEAPMAVPEDGVPLSCQMAERCFSFGLKYLGGIGPQAKGAKPLPARGTR